MAKANCTLSAPWNDSSFTHLFHIPSAIVYLTAFYLLFERNPTPTLVYRRFMVAQVVVNIISEVNLSLFIKPIPHFPHALYQTTGIWAMWGFRGLTQFYIFAAITMTSGLLIIEMLFYRYKFLMICNQLPQASLQLSLGIFRICYGAHYFIIFATFANSVEVQDITLINLLEKFPTLPQQITCSSSVTFAYNDIALWVLAVYYVVMVLISAAIVIVYTYYINRYLFEHSQKLAEPRKRHKEVIFALNTQTIAYFFFIFTPCAFQFYALFFEFKSYVFAKPLLFCITYQGCFSTLTMLLLTTPFRRRLFQRFRKLNYIDPSTISKHIEMIPVVSIAHSS